LADLGNIGPNLIQVILHVFASFLLLLDRPTYLCETIPVILASLTVSAVANHVGGLSSGNLFNINGGCIIARGEDRLANVLCVVIDELISQFRVSVLSRAGHHRRVR
jgi:hypothetical protein